VVEDTEALRAWRASLQIPCWVDFFSGGKWRAAKVVDSNDAALQVHERVR
jgi:hypothetical protein